MSLKKVQIFYNVHAVHSFVQSTNEARESFLMRGLDRIRYLQYLFSLSKNANYPPCPPHFIRSCPESTPGIRKAASESEYTPPFSRAHPDTKSIRKGRQGTDDRCGTLLPHAMSRDKRFFLPSTSSPPRRTCCLLQQTLEKKPSGRMESPRIPAALTATKNNNPSPYLCFAPSPAPPKYTSTSQLHFT